MEVRVEFGVELAIVAEEDANGFVGINGAELKVCTEVVMEVVAVIAGDLEAV